MTFLTTVLAIYSGIMLSVASVAGFIMFFRNRQMKKISPLYAKNTKGGGKR